MFHMLDMRPGQPAYMEQLARAFEALRKALTSLQDDYEASSQAVREFAFLPYSLQDPNARQVCPLNASVTESCRTCLPSITFPVLSLQQIGMTRSL